MDQKSWIWKRKSTEKTLSDKANISLRRNEELTEVQELLGEKAEMERDLKILDDKLSAALSECKANDNMAKKQMKMAQEAISGWEKSELETVSLKQELDYVLQQKAASDERLGHLDAALKQCMQQLWFVREEQEERVHGAVAKTKEEFEKTRIILEEKLSEAVKRVAKLDSENTHLSKALSGKDKVVADLSKYRTHVEADLNALILRVESAEKENTSLKYEVRVLEKERDIRNEEREFTRRTSEVTQKQLQESAKKIAKLESECQRLRLLVRKRLPGPAALAKMKNEVEMLGKHQVEIRRRRPDPFLISSGNFHSPCDTPGKRIHSLTEQLHAIEEENRILVEALRKQSGEQHFARTTCARTPSRLSRAGEIEESLEDQTTAEPGHLCFFPKHSLAASSEMESNDQANSEESWASALISELDHFKTEKQSATPSHKNMGSSDMNLMADFVEMEKLAVVSLDYLAGSSHHSSEAGNGISTGPSGSPSGGQSSPAPGMELVPVYDFQSEPLPDNLGDNRVPAKLGEVLKMLLDHCYVFKRNPHEVLEDIRAALSQNHGSNAIGGTDSNDASNSREVNGHVSLVSPSKSSSLDASYASNGHDISVKLDSDQIFLSNVRIAVHKILELLEGINATSDDNCVAKSSSGKADKLLSYKDTKTPTGYIVRVFQWKAAELTTILRQFCQTCNDFLNGTADLQQLVQLVASSFEWVMNHCFSVQDVSSMKDEIFNHLDWDESKSEIEIDNGSANNLVESNQLHTKIEEMSYQPDTVNFKIELQESKVIIEDLRSDMETMKPCKGKTENKIEKRQELETRVLEAGLEEGKSHQNLESKVENNEQYCSTPEETSHGIKTQLQSMTSKEVVPVARKDRDHQLRTEMEIAVASEKLAECQETILNLGKQLKALASPVDAALFENVKSTTSGTVVTNVSTLGRNSSQRSSLLDKMQADDDDQTEVFHMIKEDTQNVNNNPSVSIVALVESWGKLNDLKANNVLEQEKNVAASMAILPVKTKEGKSFLKKLFWLKKRSNV